MNMWAGLKKHTTRLLYRIEVDIHLGPNQLLTKEKLTSYFITLIIFRQDQLKKQGESDNNWSKALSSQTALPKKQLTKVQGNEK